MPDLIRVLRQREPLVLGRSAGERLLARLEGRPSDEGMISPIFRPRASCGPPPVPKFARKFIAPVDGTCNYTTEVHPIGSLHAGAIYTDYGACAPYVANETELYNVGAAVDLTDFVSAVIVNDP